MSKEKVAQSKPDWQRHEDHVAALYRRLGFKVSQNINIDGQQVDMVCEKWIPGIGPTRLCIECKHTGSDENISVSKDDVTQFIFNFRSGAAANGWTAGAIVSNRPFTQFAKAAASSHSNIHLKTVDELQREILNIHSYLHESVRRYEESNRFFDFVRPYGSQSRSSATSSNSNILLDRFVKDWLKDQSIQQLCLFGDFGTGKTTFLQYLHYSFSQDYLSHGSGRIPILISLGKYYDAVDHKELLKQFFAQECGVDLQYSSFQEFLDQGRILLLLDGFDEMGSKSDPATRKVNYLKLASLVNGSAKVLISCRPAYFLSIEETHSLFASVNRQVGFSPPIKQGPASEYLFRAVQDSDLKSLFSQTKSALSRTIYVNITLFDKRQIRTYLRKHEGTIAALSNGQIDSQMFFTRIGEIYDLKDLSKRPILLHLIVQTLPRFRRESEGTYQMELVGGGTRTVSEITPAILYETYTENELAREYTKARPLLKREDKVRIIADIAFEMFKSDELALDKARILARIERVIPIKDINQGYYLTDIRTCSFLTRDSQDSIRFTHKSFMEYYAAVYIRMEMTGPSAVQRLLSMRELSDEVAAFLGETIVTAPNGTIITTWLVELYEHLQKASMPSQTCLQNILNVLNYARSPIRSVNRINVDVLTYRRLELQELNGVNQVIGILSTEKVKAARWKIDNSKVKRWNASGSHFGELSADSTDIRSLRFTETTIGKVSFSQVVVNIAEWQASQIKNATFVDSVIFCQRTELGSLWVPHQGIFERCLLIGLDLRGDFFYGLQFKHCTFVMCIGDEQPRKSIEIEDSRGVLLTAGGSGIRGWHKGICSCGARGAELIRSRPLPNAPTWHELLLTSFDPEAVRGLKSEHEIRAKLRHVDLAALLATHVGENVLFSGGTLSGEAEYRIVKCDAHRITLFNHVSKSEITHPIGKIGFEQGNPSRLRVELD